MVKACLCHKSHINKVTHSVTLMFVSFIGIFFFFLNSTKCYERHDLKKPKLKAVVLSKGINRTSEEHEFQLWFLSLGLSFVDSHSSSLLLYDY